MPRTILPKRIDNEIPIATDDVTLAQLIKDPNIPQFPQNTSVDNYYVEQPVVQQFVPQQQQILTAAAETTAANNAEVLVENTNSDWINKRWRPAMGWMYMVVCIFDFILFPIMFTLVQFYETQVANDAFRQWQPITLQGGGLFHVAMGAVLGIAAYGRTKEKIEGAAK